MGDELRPDQMRDLWCDQPVEPVRMSADELRRKAQVFEAKIRRGFRGLVVLMVLAAAGWASFLYFFPNPVHRIGASLTLAGYLYCAYLLHKRRPPRKIPDGPAAATCAVYRTELERQRDFCLSAWRTFILPFVPGPAVFVMGFLVPEQGLLKAAGLTAVLILWPLILAIPLFRRKVRILQREIDELEELMKH